MPFSSHLLEFLEFIALGFILGFIFDFFRGYRKLKKSSTLVVTIQDVIYFVIVMITMLIGLILFLNTEIRAYIFIAIVIGILVYEKFFSKFFLKIILNFYKISNEFFRFLVLPINLLFNFFKKIYNFLKKIIEKCCKKFCYMISILHRVVFCRFVKQKREKYGKKRKSKCRNGKKQKKK